MRKPNGQTGAAHRRDTPKDKRRGAPKTEARKLVDPGRTLGHAARGRRRS